jgi:hypothetical protein
MTEPNERRRFVTGTIAGLAGGAFAAMSADSAQATEVKTPTRVGLRSL